MLNSASPRACQPAVSGSLCARLPPSAAPAESLLLSEPLDASTWKVDCGKHGTQPVHAALDHLSRAFAGSPGPGARSSLDHVFVQFRMDSLGRHEYVRLGEVERCCVQGQPVGSLLSVVLEDEVKALKRQSDESIVILTALPPEQLLAGPSAAPAAVANDPDLCPPKGLYRNYNVVEDLTLGPTQRVMLSDENTLTTGVQRNGIKIFNYLALIVNCHEHEGQSNPGKYNVGSAHPKILYRPIHELMRATPDVRIAVMDEIQKEMWRCLQEGSVAVHCLAGVHRAPTVVVCHFLYRHYVLGHKQVKTDIDQIYRGLRAIRPGVDPLSYRGPIIETYKDYLVRMSSQQTSSDPTK